MASKSRPSAGPTPISVSISAATSTANASRKCWDSPPAAGAPSSGPPPPRPSGARPSRPPRSPDRPPVPPPSALRPPSRLPSAPTPEPPFSPPGQQARRRGSRLPSRSPPGIAQHIAGLDKFPRQVLETAIRRDLRPHLCFRRRRNVPRHRLPRPLPRQQKLRMSRVPWTRTMTARRAAPPKPPPQRTGTHRANRRHLTGQLCAAPFQNIDLYIGHRADPPPDGIPPTASYRQFRLPSAPLLLPSTFLTCTLPAGSRLVCQSDFRGRYFVPGLGPGFAGAGALASIRPTIHSASCRVSVRPAAIAGEVRSVLCTRQKL